MKTIEDFLPHRSPFLLVDSIVDYVGGEMPVLNAEFPIRGSEFVFAGTQPPFYWPSVYIIEGLGQCCSLLSHIWTYERGSASNTLPAKNVRTILENGEDTNRDDTSEQLLEIIEDSTMRAVSRIGVLASVDVEITGRVQAGELLQYSVERTHIFQRMSRFSVQASVEGKIVAQGSIVGAQLESML